MPDAGARSGVSRWSASKPPVASRKNSHLLHFALTRNSFLLHRNVTIGASTPLLPANAMSGDPCEYAKAVAVPAVAEFHRRGCERRGGEREAPRRAAGQ